MQNILPDLDLLGLPFIVPLEANEDSSDLLKTKQTAVIKHQVYAVLYQSEGFSPSYSTCSQFVASYVNQSRYRRLRQ